MGDVSAVGSRDTTPVGRGEEDRGVDPADRADVVAAADEVNTADADAVATELTEAGDGFETTNPASFLGDESIGRAEMDRRLAEMSHTELKDTIIGVDQPAMGYGERVTEEGWAALHGEIDRRFTEAFDAGDFSNPELARLSQEVTRWRDFGRPGGPPYSERAWRERADFETSRLENRRDPVASETRSIINETNQMISRYVDGGLRPAEMTNRDLLRSVEDIPGMQAFGNLAALTGPGLILSFAAEARADERIGELQARMADGRLPQMDVEEMTASSAARIAGGVVLAAEVAEAVHPRGWLRDGFEWAGRRLGRLGRRAGPPPGAVHDEAYTLSRHTLDGSRAQSALRRGRDAHVFDDGVDLSALEARVWAEGTNHGTIRGWERISLTLDSPIGRRVQNGRDDVPLNTVEIKFRTNADGVVEYHLVPRTRAPE